MYRTVWFSCRHSEERSRCLFLPEDEYLRSLHLARIFPKRRKNLFTEIWVWFLLMELIQERYRSGPALKNFAVNFLRHELYTADPSKQIGGMDTIYICIGIKNPVSTRKQDFHRQGLKIFNRTFPLCFTHVIQPCEKRDETNDNQELVKPEAHKGPFKNSFKEVAEKVPESVHVLMLISVEANIGWFPDFQHLKFSTFNTNDSLFSNRHSRPPSSLSHSSSWYYGDNRPWISRWFGMKRPCLCGHCLPESWKRYRHLSATWSLPESSVWKRSVSISCWTGMKCCTKFLPAFIVFRVAGFAFIQFVVGTSCIWWIWFFCECSTKFFSLFKNESPVRALFDSGILLGIAALLLFACIAYVSLVPDCCKFITSLQLERWLVMLSVFPSLLFLSAFIFSGNRSCWFSGKNISGSSNISGRNWTCNSRCQKNTDASDEWSVCFVTLVKLRGNYYKNIIRTRTYQQIVFLCLPDQRSGSVAHPQNKWIHFRGARYSMRHVLRLLFHKKRMWFAELLLWILGANLNHLWSIRIRNEPSCDSSRLSRALLSAKCGIAPPKLT